MNEMIYITRGITLRGYSEYNSMTYQVCRQMCIYEHNYVWWLYSQLRIQSNTQCTPSINVRCS